MTGISPTLSSSSNTGASKSARVQVGATPSGHVCTFHLDPIAFFQPLSSEIRRAELIRRHEKIACPKIPTPSQQIIFEQAAQARAARRALSEAQYHASRKAQLAALKNDLAAMNAKFKQLKLTISNQHQD